MEGFGGMSSFFGFRQMVSRLLIKIIYILGFVVLSAGGLYMIFIPGGDETKLLCGVGAITLGNLLWRVLCEAWILIFSIHELLGSIEEKVSTNASIGPALGVTKAYLADD